MGRINVGYMRDGWRKGMIVDAWVALLERLLRLNTTHTI
jgi:hypothetical protein